MKKIINGKIYNIETSIYIGECSNNLSESNFKNWKEVLYKSKKGQYFIYGSGGALTSYAHYEGSMTYGSSDIKLINKDEILKWIEKYYQYFSQKDIDTILKELGEVEEG